MTRRSSRGHQTRELLQQRHVTVRMEWAQSGRLRDLVQHDRVAETVAARTGGLCVFTGCGAPIVAYPHAVSIDHGGVHHHLNRAGVCARHADLIHRVGDAGYRYREYLQFWLQRWYSERGLSPARWRALATGQEAAENTETG